MKQKCIYCFQALSVPSRFKIFQYLSTHQNKSASVNTLTTHTGLTQPTVTFHLNQLQKVGLIKKVKHGKKVYSNVHIDCENCPLTN